MERLTDPEGAEWTVVRRWTDFELPEWRVSSNFDAPGFDIPGDEIFGVLAVIAAIILMAIFLAVVAVPLLFFGVELVIAMGVAALGLAGRLALGHPWAIEARREGVLVETRHVPGWTASRAAVRELASDISIGRLRPAPSAAAVPRGAVTMRAIVALLLALVWAAGITSLIALALVPGLRRDHAPPVLSGLVFVLGVAGVLLSAALAVGLANDTITLR